jgi:hypothetical protein
MFDLSKMDWISVQVPAALISATFSVVVALITYFATVRSAKKRIAADFELALKRAAVDEKLAALKGKIDDDLAKLKGALDKELAEQKARLDNKALYAAEDVANALMKHSKWRLRSWNVIKVHLGGFSDDELRKILVRAGAIRFEAKSGSELWGLLDRNRDLLGVTQVPWDPENPLHRPSPSWVTE